MLAAAGEVPECKAVVTIAAPSDAAHVTVGLFRDRVPQIEADGDAEVLLAGRPFRIKRQFLRDAAEQNLAPKIARLGRSLLDALAPGHGRGHRQRDPHLHRGQAPEELRVARPRRSSAHARGADAAYAANVIAAWAEPYAWSGLT